MCVCVSGRVGVARRVYRGRAAALSSLAWRARRAPELPEEDDDRDSLSDSLVEDDDSASRVHVT